ncbi:helix-turn-helix domain-containing protein [Lacrimispora amygdalina]
MSKYSEQDKLRAINYYLAGHSFRETERALGIS